MSNKTLIEWNADVGTRFLTIHPDGSFDIDKDAPPLFVIGELAKAFIRQQDRIKRLEEELMDTKNKHAVLVADVVLNEDRAERIKRLESVENSHADVLKAIDNWMQQHKTKEAKP